jgi:hypothetical protein
VSDLDDHAGPLERQVLDYGAPLSASQMPVFAPKFRAVARGVDDLHRARTNRSVAWRGAAVTFIISTLVVFIGAAVTHFIH